MHHWEHGSLDASLRSYLVRAFSASKLHILKATAPILFTTLPPVLLSRKSLKHTAATSEAQKSLRLA